MNLEKFLTLIAVLLAFMGSIYMVHGILRLTPDIIAEQATTKWGYNSHQLESISTQKSDFVVGVWFLFLAFFVQIVNIIFVKKTDKLFPSHWTGVAIALIISISILLVMFFIGKNKKQEYLFQSKREVVIHRIRKIIDEERFTTIYLDSIMQDAKNLFDLKKAENEKARDFLKRYADLIDYPKLLEFKINEKNP